MRTGSARQRPERVVRRDVERREMAQVPRENRKIVDARRRRDGEVGKAGRVAGGARPVHQQSRAARRGRVERHHPVAVEMENGVEPVVEAVGPREAARPPQPGDSVADLGHGDRRQEQFAGTRVQPVRQGPGAVPAVGRSHRKDVRVHQIHGGPRTLQLRVAGRARVARRQVALFEPRGGEEAAERRDRAQAVPFVEADKDGPGLSAAGDDGRLAFRRIIDQSRQGGLGLAQLHRSHDSLPDQCSHISSPRRTGQSARAAASGGRRNPASGTAHFGAVVPLG